MIVTASVDTTCTVWDLNTATARTQLIAHDKEVFDVAFTANTTDVFASVGSDGSVRLFDLRALEHSTIVYESPMGSPSPGAPAAAGGAATIDHSGNSPTAGGNPAPLLRISACPREPNLLATFAALSNTIHILDIRKPGTAILQLESHASSINALQWAPDSRSLIASCGDDCQVLVWDCNHNSTAELGGGGGGASGGFGGASDMARCREPVLAWTAESEVNNISWSAEGDRIATAYGKSVQILKL